MNVDEKAKIVIESDLCLTVRIFVLINVSSHYWSPFHANDCVLSRKDWTAKGVIRRNCWKGRCTSSGFAQSISCLFSTTSLHSGLDTCFYTKFALTETCLASERKAARTHLLHPHYQSSKTDLTPYRQNVGVKDVLEWRGKRFEDVPNPLF